MVAGRSPWRHPFMAYRRPMRIGFRVVCEIDGAQDGHHRAGRGPGHGADSESARGAGARRDDLRSAEDVEPTDGADPADWNTWNAGKVALKDYKRARPMVLRVNKDQCLRVEFKPADSSNGRRRASSVALVKIPVRCCWALRCCRAAVRPTRGRWGLRTGPNWASPVPGAPDKGSRRRFLGRLEHQQPG